MNDDFSPLLFVMCLAMGAVLVVGVLAVLAAVITAAFGSVAAAVLAAVLWFRRTSR